MNIIENHNFVVKYGIFHVLSSGGWRLVSSILKWVTPGTFGMVPSAVTVFNRSVDNKLMVLKCVNVVF